MDFSALKNRLPTGVSDFAEIRRSNCIYVDKTKYVYDLTQSRAPVFISRPRRFGKSTLISTFEELFTHGVKPYDGHESYFKNLYIEDKWVDDGQYLIMKLDFSSLFVGSCSSGEKFLNKFLEVLKKFCLKFNVPIEETGDLATLFNHILQNIPNRSLVILVDEYDYPLTRNICHPDVFEDIAEVLRAFYQCIKSNSGKYRFIFITGITRYKDSSIFTAGNTISDESQNPDFGEIVGYTRDEIKNNFGENLKYSSSILKNKNVTEVIESDIEELLDELASMYDGYCFDKRIKTHVFSTWSIINFFSDSDASFDNYWYDGGGLPTILRSYLLQLKDNIQEVLNTDNVIVKKSVFNNPTDLATMDANVLLYQTGYLTFEKITTTSCFLKLPNKEIKDSLTNLYFENIYFNDRQREALQDQKLSSCKDAQDIFDYFNQILNAVDYEHYPLTQESAVTNSLFLFFLGYSITYPSVNVHSAKGRADLIIDEKDRRIVCELKYARDDGEVDSLLEEAVNQLKDKDYGNTVQSPTNTIKLALVFSQEQKKFVVFKQI